jgi:hypothetical protein
MKLNKLLTLLAIVAAAGAAVVAGCQGIGSGSTIQKLVIFPADGRAERPLRVYPCIRDAVVVEGFFTDGTIANFTGRATWTSSDPSVVDVTHGTEFIPETPTVRFGKGVLRAKTTSSTPVTISADFAGLHTSIDVLVEPAPVFKISALTQGATFNTPNTAPQLAVGSKMALGLFTELGGKPRTVGAAVQWLLDVGAGPVPDDDSTNPRSPFVTLGEFNGLLTGRRADEGGAGPAGGPIPQAAVAFGEAIDPGTGPYSTDCQVAQGTIAQVPIRVGNVTSVALSAESGFSNDGKIAVKTGQQLQLLGTLDFGDGGGPQPNPQDLSLASHYEELCTRRTCDANGANCSDAQDVACVVTDKLCPTLTAVDSNNQTFCRLDTRFLVVVPNYPITITAPFTPTTLAADVPDTTSTTISILPMALNTAVEWPAQIDGETVLVKSIDTTNTSVTVLTVVRGYAGSTAATHLSGALMSPVATHLTARYPSAAGDDTTITTAIGAGDTTVTLASIAHYPLPPWEGVIDDGTASQEDVLVTAVTNATTNLTVVRGYRGSTAQAHNAGATFKQFSVKAPTPLALTPANGTLTTLAVCQLGPSSDPLCPSYANPFINAFDTLQLEAIGTFNDTVNPDREQRMTHAGAFSNLESPKVAWSSSDLRVAFVTATGLVESTGECGGTVVLRARSNSSTDTADKKNIKNDPLDPTTLDDDTACTGDALCDQVTLDVCPAPLISPGVTCDPKPASCP